MSQLRTIVEAAKNGSMQAEVGSGIRGMSDSLIAFQPAIEEPSNIRPSVNASSSISDWSNVTCCHLPRGSVNRRSTYLMSLSLMCFRTSWAVFIGSPVCFWPLSALDRVRAGLAGADADGFVDRGHEDFAV